MASKRSQIKIPQGVDDRYLRRLYASTRAKQERLFKQDSDRFALVHKLRASALKKDAKAARVKVPPLGKHTVAEARSTLAVLRKRRPPLPPIIRGHNPTVFPPYSSTFTSSPAPSGPYMEFVPWAGSPNASTGQVGSTLVTWGVGAGIIRYDVELPYYLWAQGTYRLTVTATVSGIYYLYSPSMFSFAYSWLALNVWADDANFAPDYMPQTSNVLCERFLLFPGRDWNYVSGQFQASVEFVAGDAPTPYIIGAGTTQQVIAMDGCIAGMDADTTINSLDIELL